MLQSRPHRARRWTAVVVVALIALGTGLVRGVHALDNAQTTRASNAFATTALYAPSGLSASYAGHDASLTWSAGTNGSGYTTLGAANGSSSDCSSASFSSIGTTSSLSYTDAGRYTPQGTWYCYQVQTSYASWTSASANPTVATRIGFVATSVTLANGGTAGKLDTGDTITITFNQPMNTATGPTTLNQVCAITGSTIVLGTTTTVGPCSATETNNLGTLTGGTSNKNGRWSTTWAWSNNNQTLTMTIGVLTGGSPDVTGTWTFNPVTTSTKLQSATGSFHICDTNSGGGLCLPTATGSF